MLYMPLTVQPLYHGSHPQIIIVIRKKNKENAVSWAQSRQDAKTTVNFAFSVEISQLS